MIDRHKREGRIYGGVDDRDVQSINRVDWLPVMHGGATERVDGELQASAADSLHINDVAQIPYVGQDKIFVMRRLRAKSGLEPYPPYGTIPVPQKFIRAVLHPFGHMRFGRATMCGVVFETAVFGWVVRRRDDNAVREMPIAGAVVYKDRVRNDRCRGYAVGLLYNRMHFVCGQDLERGALSGSGKRVRVLAHVQGTIRALRAPVVANRLVNREDMRLGERPVQRRAAMPARAKADPLFGGFKLRPARVVFTLQPDRIDQHLPRCRLARQR